MQHHGGKDVQGLGDYLVPPCDPRAARPAAVACLAPSAVLPTWTCGLGLANRALTAALDASVSDDSCNLEELKAVLRKAKLSNPDEIAIQLMNEFDVNGDQTLDAEEMKMVKKRLQELESAEARQGGRGGGGNPSFGGAITDADMQLLDGFTSLEDRVQGLSRMNDAPRHVQTTCIEEMLGSLR